VGACAIDAAGHVAPATSTGGITGKRRGRVGDTPLCGCGTYADDQAGAASATGHGESIIRVTMSRVAVDRMRAGLDASAAAWAAVDELDGRVHGTGGIICVDRAGRLGLAHNTASMSWARGAVGGAVASGVRVTR
jgi:beta-aspartyl-peptidase (threonine type)